MTGFSQRRISTMYVPTVDDVAYARQLAEKLRGRDDADTLNNVLEWVEKNMSYWRERGYLDLLYGSTLYLYIYAVVIITLLLAPPLFLLSVLVLHHLSA
ncbi:MAG: transglutaminase-like domain-containing protein, partial [Desulfurococcaceae archaeon]